MRGLPASGLVPSRCIDALRDDLPVRPSRRMPTFAMTSAQSRLSLHVPSPTPYRTKPPTMLLSTWALVPRLLVVLDEG